MSEVIDAFAELDAAKAFSAVDKVIQAGQDARRFLEDLLERLRDLMLVSSLGDGARAILRGLGPEQFDVLTIQANRFGLPQLTAAAEATSKALSDTTASSNPRLQLELLCARVLAPAIDASTIPVRSAPSQSAPVQASPAKSAAAPAPEKAPAPIQKEEPAAPKVQAPKAEEPAPKAPAAPMGTLTTAGFKSGWQGILDALSKQSRSAWAVAFTTKVLDYQDEVLTLLFQSQKDVDAFKGSQGASEVLRQVIFEQFGVKVKYKAKVADAVSVAPIAPVIEPTAPEEFVSEEEMEEVTEAIPVAPTQSEEKAGEFMLREVLGAQPMKGDD
jgi:DNA polymerase-3 subunit gamma/tau